MPSKNLDCIPILASGIAKYASSTDGLVAVYMPRGMDPELAYGIALAANEGALARDSGSPYAIVVNPFKPANYVEITADGVTVVSVAGAIRYRTGDRLVVVLGESADLESFRGVFRSAIGPEFPARSESTIDGVAMEVSEKLGSIAGADREAIETAAEDLALAMRVLADVLRDSEDPQGNWTARWYSLTEIALATLQRKLISAMELDVAEDFVEFIRANSYGAFVLPRPEYRGSNNAPAYKHKNAGLAIGKALNEYWYNSESAEHSQIMVTGSRRDKGQPELRINWDGLDDQVTECGSVVEAVQCTLLRDPKSLSAFCTLAEAELLAPEPPDIAIEALTSEGVDLAVSAVEGSEGHCLVQSSWVSRSIVETQPIRFRIRIADCAREDLASSTAALHIAEAKCEFHGTRTEYEGGLEFLGAIQFQLAPERVKEKKLTVSIGVRSDDSLSGKLGNAIIKLVAIPPVDSACALYFDVQGKGKLAAKTCYAGPTSRHEEGSYEYLAPTNNSKRTFVVLQAGSIENYSNFDLRPVEGRSDLYAGVINAGARAGVVAAGKSFIFESEEESRTAVSPLRAAALKCALNTDDLSTTLSSDIRSVFESYMSGPGAADRVGTAFGHVIASSECMPGSDVDIVSREGSLTLGCSIDDVPALVNGRVFHRERLGIAADNFDRSFRRIAEELWEEQDSEQWISRISLRALYVDHRDLLDDYLESYSSLLGAASADKRGGRRSLNSMMAAYPFSMSVWHNGRCEGVYISPLHPIRLAWLAATEATLYDSNETENLIGAIEGWKFPFVGKAPNRYDVLMSTPIDSGPQEVFAGWELMVPIAGDDTHELVVPERLAGIAAPGTTSSGLTASAVESAIREYLRINPQDTSLNLDLAASSVTERVEEIDDAVVQVVARSLADDLTLSGITVQDSIMRTGEPPWDGLSKLNNNEVRRRLTWMRYDPASSKRLPAAQIRIQPDSLLSIGCTDGQVDDAAGIVGPVPLRRFMAEYPRVDQEELVINPLIDRRASSSSPFDRALSDFEAGIESRELRITPRELKAQEKDRVAEWTIAGESLISPNAIQEVLSSMTTGDESRMLWEWRPPAFDYVEKSLELESRGYVTLSKVPEPLIAKVDEKLKKAIDQDRFNLDAADVFRALGARGIGLASLLTAGDKQASGAIGFYLALSLCDRIQKDGSVRVILPIDSSQGFLDALSGQQANRAKHRADLLMIEIADEGVTFIPIEVKMYGLSAKTAYSPSALDAVIAEAVDQVSASRQQLEAVLDRRDTMVGAADCLLWDNALAALLETALKLAAPESGGAEVEAVDLTRLFGKVIHGEASLQVADGLVMCFSSSLPGSHDWHTGHMSKEAGGVQVIRATPEHVVDLGQSDLDAACAACLREQVLSAHIRSTNDDSVRVQKDHNNEVDNERVSDEISERDLDVSDAALSEMYVHHDQDVELEKEIEFHESPTSPDLHQIASVDADDVSDKRESLDDSEPSDLFEPGNRDESALSASPVDSSDLIRPGVKFDVGSFCNSVGSKRPELWLGNTSLNQLNIGVVGDLGTGKTQLVKSLMAQIRHFSTDCQSKPASILVFDYKHDYCDDEFIRRVGGVVLKPDRIPLNLFALRDDELENNQARERKIRAFVDVLQKIYSGIGPKQKNNLRSVIREGYREFAATPPTLQWIYENYEAQYGGDSVVGMLDGFVNMEVFDDGSERTRTFDELLEGKVLVLDLKSLGTDQDLKNALVVLFLNLYYEWMGRLDKHPFLGGEPSIRYVSSYVVVDEATNIMEYDFPVLEQILLQGREFGVGVLLSSQYLSHFKTKETNWAEPLLTWFIHKVPTISTADLKRAGLTVGQDLADQIPKLKVHQALYKSLDSEARLIRGMPFFELFRSESEESGV